MMVGCAAEASDHPAAAAADPSNTVPQAIDVEVHCTPNELRECRHYYVDEHGQLQCPMSTQQCDADGQGWSDCGSRIRSATAGQ